MKKTKLIIYVLVALVLLTAMIILLCRSCSTSANAVQTTNMAAVDKDSDEAHTSQAGVEDESNNNPGSEQDKTPEQDVPQTQAAQSLSFVDELCMCEDSSVIVSIQTLLGEDRDAGDILLVSLSDSQHGTITDNGDGTYTYTPGSNYSGRDTLSFTILDSAGEQIEASIEIVIDPINDAPSARDDQVITDEDVSIAIEEKSLLANDRDRDSKIRIIKFSEPQFGTLTKEGDSTYTYTPDADYFGSDSFTYTVSDGEKKDTAVVTIIINTVNDAPEAQDDAFTTDEDTALTISGLLDNDTDKESDTLSILSTTLPGHGTLVDNGNGTYTYTPDADYFGTDSFTYTISDGEKKDTAVVTITINTVNDTPEAQDDAFTTDEDTAVTISGLLDNDTDKESDTLSILSTTLPDHGTLFDNGNGTYTYIPDANYFGSDSFTYTISDGTGTDTASVTITVIPVNDAPLAGNDAVDIDMDTPLVIVAASLLSNDGDVDGDTLTIVSTTAPSNGTLVDNGNGTYTYTPDQGYHGSDSFGYTVGDGTTTDTATVTITVNYVNSAPDAVGDSFATDVNTALTISAADMLSNDTDPEGDTITILSVTSPSNGTLVDNGNGTYTYTPDNDYTGDDSFTYTISDGDKQDTASVTITINAANRAPIVNNESTTVSFFSYSYKSVYVLSNDSDPDGDSLTITRVWGWSMGSVINDGYRIRYQSDHYWMGTDTVYYEVSDGNGGTSTGKLTVYIDY